MKFLMLAFLWPFFSSAMQEEPYSKFLEIFEQKSIEKYESFKSSKAMQRCLNAYVERFNSKTCTQADKNKLLARINSWHPKNQIKAIALLLCGADEAIMKDHLLYIFKNEKILITSISYDAWNKPILSKKLKPWSTIREFLQFVCDFGINLNNALASVATVEQAQFLLDKGASLYKQSEKDEPLLNGLVYLPNSKTIIMLEFFLDKGANVKETDKLGNTALLQLAHSSPRYFRYIDVLIMEASLLLRYGSDLTETNLNGKTVFSILEDKKLYHESSSVDALLAFFLNYNIAQNFSNN